MKDMSEKYVHCEYSRPEDERAGTHLVLLLHGYGSHEKDLLSLAEHLPQEGITYAGMRAPQPVGTQFSADATGAHIPDEAIGYQWYPLDQQLNADVRSIEQAATTSWSGSSSTNHTTLRSRWWGSRKAWRWRLLWCGIAQENLLHWWGSPDTRSIRLSLFQG